MKQNGSARHIERGQMRNNAVKILIVVLSISLFAAIIGGVLIVMGISVRMSQEISIFDLTNIIGPLLFSLMLVILYWQLYDIQKHQTEIQEDQRSIQAQHIRPYIVIEDSHIIKENEVFM